MIGNQVITPKQMSNDVEGIAKKQAKRFKLSKQKEAIAVKLLKRWVGVG